MWMLIASRAWRQRWRSRGSLSSSSSSSKRRGAGSQEPGSATAAAIRQEYQQSSATPPEWSLYLIQPTEARADGTKVGQQTCLLQQLANMVNGPVMLTPDAIRKV